MKNATIVNNGIRYSQIWCKTFITYRSQDPSQVRSIGSLSAWYWGGPGFKSPQGREFFSDNK